MTDAELEAVRARHEAAGYFRDDESLWGNLARQLEATVASAADVPALLAEVWRLRRENAELRAAVNGEGRP